MGLQTLCLALAFCAISASAKGLVDPLKVASSSSNDFSHDLFDALSDSYKGANLICSPLSVFTALSLLLLGARGKTSKLISQSLHLPADISMVGISLKSLVDDYEKVNIKTLDIANKIFVSDRFSIDQIYINNIGYILQSKPGLINLNKASNAANTINNWVSKRTNQKIQDFIDPSSIKSNTAMLLISAIYFQDRWAHAFEEVKHYTKFYTNEDTFISVSYMQVEDEFAWGHIDELKAQFIRLLYQNEDFEMIIIMPDEKGGLSEMEKRLKSFDYNKLSGSTQNVSVTIPKFKFESSIDLKDALIKLGLANLFKSPDLRGISNDNLLVSAATQKAFIEVNEDGTEAAAATAIGVIPLIGVERNTMLVDRPFHFIIRKLSTVLFQGHVYDPRQ